MATLPIFPDIAPTHFEETVEDSAIKDSFENGWVQTRQKYTRARKIYRYAFTNIPESDADTVMDFYYLVGTWRSFTLNLPKGKGTVAVRFTHPPKRVFVTPNTSSITDVEFREV